MSYTAQELNRKITIQQVTVTQDPVTGELTEGWADVGEAFAKVEPLVGREYFLAGAIQAESTVKFTMRYRAGLTASMRLIHEGKPYGITTVINVKGRNRETLVMAQRLN